MSPARLLTAAIVSTAISTVGCDSTSSGSATTSDSGSSSEHSQRKDVVKETTFDDIKFEMELTDTFERTMLTPQIEGLFGQRIRIRGYIFPTLKKKGLTQFVLVRDNMECCFGPGAALYDCILVHMEPGRTAEFSIRPVAVQGTFRYEIFPDFDGTTRAIYRLDGELVE